MEHLDYFLGRTVKEVFVENEGPSITWTFTDGIALILKIDHMRGKEYFELIKRKKNNGNKY